MKKRKHFIQLLLIVGLLFALATACDKTDDPDGDFPSAGTVKDIDGNKYNTVKIGNQVWMVENLKTTKYNDGTQIPNLSDDNQWLVTTDAYCNYDNLESNAATYGRLYNGYAVKTGKLAPAGWRIPNDADWIILRNYLIANGYNFDGTKDEDKVAKSLCAKTNWALSSEPGTPGAAPENNNRTGFTALPGGYRYVIFGNNPEAHFSGIGKYGEWWSTTELDKGGGYGRLWELKYNHDYLDGYRTDMVCGHSVRLIKD
ncbi:MAG TPA: fibrobacter succinogenes major paralogous domain-containing protein [Bacteroidales bacterium]|nr:fibrobacter succinogenes major paralogous domain-containing protein [Bacteroidales bacterium]